MTAMTQQVIDRIMRRIDPTGDINEDIESQIRDICEDTESQLCVMLDEDEVPEKLSYIVVAVSVKRYNRIGSEGTSSHSVEGESMSWTEDPFAEYLKDIEAWKNAHSGYGMHVRFL